MVVTAVMGIIAVGASGLLLGALKAHEEGGTRLDLQREGLLVMERLNDAAQRCTFLLVPNSHAPVRSFMAMSGFVNDDDDYYFNDPLFPRIDEDIASDMNEDKWNGIGAIDEDGDGSVDENTSYFSAADDDEDGRADEDPLNGIDDDGDGNVDEDCAWDTNWDGRPGIANFDDDGDGSIDEGNQGDDDEDGTTIEQGIFPHVFWYDAGSSTLTSWEVSSGESFVLSRHVAGFQVEYVGPELVTFRLRLQDGNETLSIEEHACIRNSAQRLGKRVR